MYDIEVHEASPEFELCWSAAGSHLDSQVQDGLQSWLRAHLTPPFLEHLSFRLGNQLFFVRLEDIDGRLKVPGSLHGLLAIADGCRGSACLMPMKKKLLCGDWVPAHPGWGLIDVRTTKPINPVSLVTDENVPITAWEMHDLAVQVVRDCTSIRRIRLRAPKRMSPPLSPHGYWTRHGIVQWLVARLTDDVPTLVGIDHSFSLPLRYLEVHRLPSGRHHPDPADTCYGRA